MPRLVGPCASRPACGGSGSEWVQVRRQAGRVWEHEGGSESAAAPPIPAALLPGTREKVTGHPLSPDGRPPPVLHRHSPRVTEGLLARRLPEFVVAPVCLRPGGGKEGGTRGWP